MKKVETAKIVRTRLTKSPFVGGRLCSSCQAVELILKIHEVLNRDFVSICFLPSLHIHRKQSKNSLPDEHSIHCLRF